MWLLTVAILIAVSVVPVMVGARVVGARRNGFGWCFLALIVADLINGVALRTLHLGAPLSIFVAALGFMLILDTTYLRGLAVAVIQYVVIAVLILLFAATLFGSLLHHVMH